MMSLLRTACAAVALAALAGALQGCGAYGIRGDKGLPPAPEGVAYPNLNREPADRHRPLRSASDQARVQADVLSGRRQTRNRAGGS